MIRAVNAIIQ